MELAQVITDLDSKKRHYAMFSANGNARVHTLVKQMARKVLGEKRITQKEFEDFVKAKMDKIAIKYGEVWDTAVRECVYWYAEKFIEGAGYDWADDIYLG